MHPKHTGEENKFSPTLFIITIVLTFGAVIGLMSVTVPERIWHVQWESSPWRHLVVFLIGQFFGSFIEWGFHRYMLHKYVFPGSYRLFVQHHRRHHGALTPITDRNDVWENRYPITEPSQYEASFFPWFSYLGFLVFAAPFAILAQWVWQDYPVLVMTTVSVGWSLTVYEFLHAMEHFPMSFWKKVFEIFPFARRLYSFHAGHHVLRWMTHHNMAISGFVCGIPLADIVLGTFRLPQGRLDHGTEVVDEDVDPHPPNLAVRILDGIAEAIIKLRKATLGG